MSRLAQRVSLLEKAGAETNVPRLLLILRADRPDDDLVALGDFQRMPGESPTELKRRIERQHRSGLLILHARYQEPA